MGRAVFALVLVGTLLVGCGGGHAQRSGPTQRTHRPNPIVVGPGRLVGIGGGRSLYLRCEGSGRPTVLLEAGYPGDSSNWRDVQPHLARLTRTCAYDRAGLGNSLPRPGVHDAADEIDDLQRLLEHAALPPPYVVVGHFYGGLLARLFARARPRETAAVVLVDAVGRDATRRELAIWPRSQAPALRRRWAQPVVNGVDLRSSEALARTVRDLGDTPLIVITAGRSSGSEVSNLPASLLRSEARL